MTTLSGRLKSETAELHRLAERHPFQHDLIRGSLEPFRYRRFLKQLYFFHSGMDMAWSALPLETRILFPTQGTIRGALLHDLYELGESPATMSLGTSASQFITELLELNETSAVGARYVFEGACNGGVFISRAMRRHYGERCPPHRNLIPYGDAQKETWLKFQRGLDRVTATSVEADAVVEAAKRTFRSFIMLMEEVVGFDVSVTLLSTRSKGARHVV
ncbi:MAG: biliverdin-producing heme oxygenase [Myxococcota bacterium]